VRGCEGLVDNLYFIFYIKTEEIKCRFMLTLLTERS
jgi:hypothetical protein